jgi:type I restriction enzyme, R subunit
MNRGFSEDHVEQAGIETLKSLGWLYLDGIAISPDGAAPQRMSFADAFLTRRFDQAVRAINSGLPDEAIESALRQVLNTDKPNLIEENRRLHTLITDGVGVEYRADDGAVKSDRVWLVDFDNVEANDWLVTNQFTVIEGQRTR